eukprot:571572-Prymnesium_polylepis.1
MPSAVVASTDRPFRPSGDHRDSISVATPDSAACEGRSTAARSAAFRTVLSHREDVVRVQSGTSLQAAALARAALPASRSR